MAYNFKKSILIVVFNYSNCVCNKDIIKNIYEKHFLKIIFYSDYPMVKYEGEDEDEDEDEVNFIKDIILIKFFVIFIKNMNHL